MAQDYEDQGLAFGSRVGRMVVEKHSDGYVACPPGVKGVVVGEGDSYEEALADVTSATQFHVESFGIEVLQA